MKLDSIDIAILKEVQHNARITNVELASKVGLSPSACSRRFEQLEASGVLSGYQAVISDEALGQNVTAIVHITLDRQSGVGMESFEKAVADCPYVNACFLMSGEYDYIVRVSARDMNHFQYIHKEWLSNLPGVSRIVSSFAMRTVVNRANIDVASLSAG
ncbi:MAG: Lrp/AsnC family transcriptional regulator [Rhizobiaceae bacterium]|jgi:DNA-binding Lrp family transcriptional regulator|nr:Lrp/AsnC family transcriptional regulator [Rhizobiaceae bacterium]